MSNVRVNQRLVDDFLEELKGLPSETSRAKLGAFLVNIEESAYLAATERVNEPSIGERAKEAEGFLAPHKSVTLPKKNPCEEALTTVDFLPGREADDARHLAHAVALFFTFRSLGSEEEAGKLAAAFLSPSRSRIPRFDRFLSSCGGRESRKSLRMRGGGLS